MPVVIFRDTLSHNNSILGYVGRVLATLRLSNCTCGINATSTGTCRENLFSTKVVHYCRMCHPPEKGSDQSRLRIADDDDDGFAGNLNAKDALRIRVISCGWESLDVTISTFGHQAAPTARGITEGSSDAHASLARC
eukprot:scaffold8194_cov118-Cylindrotheca_fusiformis.AAC.12